MEYGPNTHPPSSVDNEVGIKAYLLLRILPLVISNRRMRSHSGCAARRHMTFYELKNIICYESTHTGANTLTRHPL